MSAAGVSSFYGDLLENVKRPRPGSIADDRRAALRSVARLRGPAIRRIYPGHGGPSSMDQPTNA